MPKVSAKQVQRRISELDAQYRSPAKALRQARGRAYHSRNHCRRRSHRTTSDFVQLTLKQGPTTPKQQPSDAEAQAKSNAMLGSSSTGFKSGE